MSGRLASGEEARDLLRGGRVVAFTGAGISAGSGIPTFRDPGGLWDRFDPRVFGTWDGLARTALHRPDALADFLAELRRVLARARPGPSHLALERLERAGTVDAVITQNVDGLHQEAGSRSVVELHGSFLRQVCLANEHREEVGREGLVVELDRAIRSLRTAFVPSLASILPRCWSCGGPARPDFVAFGEAVQGYEEAVRLVARCRVLLVIGTSGDVFPAAGLPDEARRSGAVIVEVAPASTLVDADVWVRDRAEDVLPGLAAAALAE
jgi:NAD-dependent deacetylase